MAADGRYAKGPRKARRADVPPTAWGRIAAAYDLQLWLERPALDVALALAAPSGDERLLDLATGTGALLRRLARRAVRPAVAVGVDASRALLARVPALPAGWRVREADGRALPFADSSFDVVTIAYLLHTLGDPTLGDVLAECLRVLRPGGRLATVTPRPARSRACSVLASPIVALARRSSGPLAGLRPLDPRPELERAGFAIERTVAVRAGYPSLAVLARRPPEPA